jgi:glycerophosphoryl diester phosphodiesterase
VIGCQDAAVQQMLPSLLDRPIAFAHRGARAHAPENTIETFKLALRLGATGLETDVWVTADGVPVLDHDGLVRSGRRRRMIPDVLRRSLPEHVPTLAELLEECGTAYHLSLDLCGEGAGPAALATVREVAPEIIPRLWLCHPRHEGLQALRALDPDVHLIDSTRLERVKEGAERRVATLYRLGIDGLNMFHSDWNGGLVALAHRFNRVAFSWGLEYERQLVTAYRMGVDAVYCDWVDRMMDTYRETLGPP